MYKKFNLHLWHEQLGHLNVEKVKLLPQQSLVESLSLIIEGKKLPFCEGCVFRKQHREPYPTESVSKAYDVFELIHFDIWGLAKSRGSKIFCEFIDDMFRK